MKLYTRATILCSLSIIGLTCLPDVVAAKSIPMPFTSQAPDGRWVQPWQDFCEEASILMVDQYYQHQKLDKAKAKKLLLHIFDIKNKTYGKSLDESTEKMADLINKFLPYEVVIVSDPTLEQIKEQVDLAQPVIIPVSGKDLHNPRFRNGGPRYHVLVISGYDDEKQEFITQEPGTQVGLDFRYPYGTILNAIHDLTPTGDIMEGARRAIFTNAIIDASSSLDGDQDGLTKQQELATGTSLTQKDTDGDGFSDGQEVSSGYSPLLNETKLANNSLIKTAVNPAVYLLINKTKRLVTNEAVFIKRGWKWQNIKTVSERFFNNLKNGANIE